MSNTSLPPAPGYLASALRVFDLSLSEMLWSRRTIFMALIGLHTRETGLTAGFSVSRAP